MLEAYDRGDGVCIHYNAQTKRCNIYETRPLWCRVDAMYHTYYQKIYTKEAFYADNAKVCNILQEEAGVDISYRVKIT